ncbi:Ca-activated chloride channel family protein [Bacillus ectoiniformans]|uniref:VWA domain-containing protein n=1 Tax=Bacillus ectoiniformans TaxID=1494429 RepID=UPI00195B107A|nr:VWA domain-containing protein [Bacillus ectoiniformans]MBM7650289.1 Ca-activated chloride channel family protein [Bacillus ectoiniformans]
MKSGTIRQILLLTDGCSNHGEDPSAMAALAREQGITVNVIGILENEAADHRGVQEIDHIAASGGGISQAVYATQLSHTVQMVTRKAMTQTLQGVVNQQLKQIFNSESAIESLPPEKRGEVMEVVDELSETAALEVLILVDTSASMKSKLPTVKEALLDLSLSMNARMGGNMFALYVFPGKESDVERLLDWTPKLESLTSIFSKLSPGGLTPTGPAIREAIAQFKKKKRSFKGWLSQDDEYIEKSI